MANILDKLAPSLVKNVRIYNRNARWQLFHRCCVRLNMCSYEVSVVYIHHVLYACKRDQFDFRDTRHCVKYETPIYKRG